MIFAIIVGVITLLCAWWLFEDMIMGIGFGVIFAFLTFISVEEMNRVNIYEKDIKPLYVECGEKYACRHSGKYRHCHIREEYKSCSLRMKKLDELIKGDKNE